jgi:hypothetical protein
MSFMSKLYLLFALLCLGFLSYGQVSFTPKIGANFATQINKLDYFGDKNFGQKAPLNPGIVAGIGIETPLYKVIRLNVDLLYSQAGYTTSTQTGYYLNKTYDLNYFMLPVSFKAYLTKGRLSPYISGGGYMAYFISGSYKSRDFTGYDNEGKITFSSDDRIRAVKPNEEYWNNLQRKDAGVTAGTGLRYALGNGNLMLELQYAHGLVDSRPEYRNVKGFYQYSPQHASKNRMVSMSLGYAIIL